MGKTATATAILDIKTLFDSGSALSEIAKIQKSLNNIKMPAKLKGSVDTTFKNLEKSLGKYETQIEKGFKTKTDVKNFNNAIDDIIKYMAKYKELTSQIQGEFSKATDLSSLVSISPETTKRLKEITKEIGELQQVSEKAKAGNISELFKMLESISSTSATKKKTLPILQQLSEGAIDSIKALEQLEKVRSGLIKTSSLPNFKPENLAIIEKIIDSLKEGPTKVNELQSKIDSLNAEKFKIINDELNKNGTNLESSGKAISNYLTAISKAGGGMSKLINEQVEFNNEIESMKQRMQYFFGINNSINLFKRGVRDAVQTVRELDAAMTETAVVTNFSVGDMWDQLPKYTEAANELGATTLGAYETMTLFYQQGLNTEQAFPIGSETMKMARIANLDYANATNLMTAALRGFNMELNETSAIKVNDVYSELAAITASDTKEIATAMTKTASIANSANMEFETTAALLSQIIETTRESAETAGTAMKTIIARFTEVKELYTKGQLSGKDSEGEVININKIDAALKTVGLSLQGFLRGEEGLDDILLSLASKWNTLDIATQRYIATTAAGSRQQSRFLAMMSNYERTTELVTAAQNSQGAGEEQFAKTQESLANKINLLSNAWDQFTMGLVHEDAIKTATQGLTGLLNVVNSLTGIFGDNVFGKRIESFLKIGLGMGILKTGSTLADTGINWIAGMGSGMTFSDATKKVLEEAQTAALAKGKKAPDSYGQLLKNQFLGPWLSPFKALKDRRDKNIGLDIEYDELNAKREILRKKFLNKQQITKKERRENEKLIQERNKIYGNMSFTRKLGTWLNGKGPFKKLKGTSRVEKGLGKLFGFGASTGAAASATSLAVAIGGITVAATAAYVALKAMYNLTATGQVKAAEKYSSALSSMAQSSAKAYEQQRKEIENYEKAQKDLYEATTPEQRQKALMANNDAVLAMLDRQPDLIKNIERTKNGELRFKSGYGYNQALENAKAKNEQNQVLAILGKALVANKKADLASSRFRAENEKVFTTQEEAEASERKKFVYQSEIDKQKFAADTYEQQAFNQLLDGRLKGTKAGEQVSSIMADTIEVNSSLADVTGINREEAERLYEQNFGFKPEAELETEDIQRANKSYELLQKYTEDNGLFNQLQDLARTSAGADLISFLSGTYTGDLSQVENLFKGNEKLLNELVKEKKYDSADAFIEAQKESINELRKSNYKEIAVAVAETSLGRAEDLENNIFGLLKYTSYEQQGQIVDALHKIEPLGQEGKEAILGNLDSLFSSPEVSDWIAGLDFENPITGAKQLADAMNSAVPGIRSMGAALQEAGKDSLSSGAQLRYFITSSDFTGMEERLQEFIKTNGKISADNIMDFASECKLLDTMMEQTSLTAEGLAEALTLVEEGKLGFDDLTDSVVASLSAFQGLSTVSANAIKNIKDFDPGLDENEVSKHIASAAETVMGNLDKGAYGNTQVSNYLKHYFGEESLMENGVALSGDALIERQKYLGQILQDNSANMSAAWEMLASGQTVTGGAVDQNLLNKLGVSYEDGQAVINGYQNYDSIDAFVKDLQLATGGTKAWAEAMITDFKNYSSDAATYFNTKDQEIGMQNFLETGAGYYDSTEIQTFSELFGETAANTLREKITSSGGVITEFYDKNGKAKDKEALLDAIKNAYVEGIKEVGADKTGEKVPDFGEKFVSKRKDKEDNIIGNTFDLKGFQDELDKLHLPKEMWEDATNQYLEQFVTVGEEGAHVIKTTIEGQDVEIPIKAGQTFQEAYDSFMKSADWKGVAQAFQEVFTGSEIEPEVNQSALNEVISSLDDAAKNRETHITPIIDSATGSVTIAGKTITISATNALGGVVSSYASGSRRIRPGTALTGEEGSEIVWNKKKGYAYMAGANGPEYNNLQPGDRVFNASETRKILANSRKDGRPALSGGGVVPAYSNGAHGYGDANKGSGSSGGGGNGSDRSKSDNWKNELDWLYNLMEDIAELERDQESLQEEYNLLLEDQISSGKELLSLTRQQLTNLYKQYDAQAFAYDRRKFEMQEFLKNNSSLSGYGTYNFDDQTIEIDWDKINALTDGDKYKEVSDYISELEDIQKKMDEAEDSLLDIESQIQEIQERFTETYTDFEKRVLDAIVAERQKEIDNLSGISDTISQTNSDLFNSIQKALDKQRQDRDNKKTEDDLAEKERRLAFLRQDTSGNNLLEIKKLEEELADARQDYTDELIDQKLTQLQDQEDFAAEQRERQIELMQSQLDYAEISGELWDEVSSLIEGAIDPNGKLVSNSALVELLKNSESWKGLSDVQRKVWGEELEKTFKEVVAYLEMGSSIGSEDKGKKVDFVDKEGNKLSGTVGSDGLVHVTDGSGQEWTYDHVTWDREKQTWVTESDRKKYVAPKPDVPNYAPPAGGSSSSSSGGGSGGGSSGGGSGGGYVPPPRPTYPLYEYVNGTVTTRGSTYSKTESDRSRDHAYHLLAVHNSTHAKPKPNRPGHTTPGGHINQYFATGGLADFTGPAWLDGTKSKPELVLNAQDTQNFIQLKDILGQAIKGGNFDNSVSSGDNYYDINISATIADDYDVDKLVNKIKKEIVNDASYRNVNVINRRR